MQDSKTYRLLYVIMKIKCCPVCHFLRSWTTYACAPDWKDNSHQTYSCPRDWRTARHHGGLIEAPPGNPRTSQHYRVEGFKAGHHFVARRQSLGQLVRDFLVWLAVLYTSQRSICSNIALYIYISIYTLYICRYWRP